MNLYGNVLFFDVITGEILVETGQKMTLAPKELVEDLIFKYKKLSDRNRESFDYIELTYNQHAQDFVECSGYRVDIETGKLVFSYPDPNEPGIEQPYQAPLSEQVEELKVAQSATDSTLLELMEVVFLGGM